ncbi:MAG: gamma-glutamylcyclotransferase [Promethearchaeota archaeon]|nr:MAG: gamma-glutamylcyclotransferase [Candidatus Lokiarchaeota archaeon]
MSVSVIGYGTFITHGHWKNKSNVRVCTVKNYIRIFPKGNWFPYVLPSEGASFKALIFEVNKQELEALDRYEGVHAGLYKRVETDVFLKNDEKKRAYIYVPTEKTINSQDLSVDLDKNDRWKEEMYRYAEIRDKFPELF